MKTSTSNYFFDWEPFRRAVRQEMANRGFGVYQLARHIGCTHGTILRVLKDDPGRVQGTHVDVLASLCKLMQLPMETFIKQREGT